jgi:anti-sigma regulatory factor (Ser/Thr protein kinase)
VQTVGNDAIATASPRCTVGVREASLVLGLAAQDRAVGAARRRVSDFLALNELETEDAESLVLVTSELCTNAVRAAQGADAEPGDEPKGEVVLGCRVAGGAVELEVTNQGEEFTLGRPVMPPPEATSGRGLSLATILMDHLVVRHRNGRTTVRATRRVRGGRGT